MKIKCKQCGKKFKGDINCDQEKCDLQEYKERQYRPDASVLDFEEIKNKRLDKVTIIEQFSDDIEKLPPKISDEGYMDWWRDNCPL